MVVVDGFLFLTVVVVGVFLLFVVFFVDGFRLFFVVVAVDFSLFVVGNNFQVLNVFLVTHNMLLLRRQNVFWVTL